MTKSWIPILVLFVLVLSSCKPDEEVLPMQHCIEAMVQAQSKDGCSEDAREHDLTAYAETFLDQLEDTTVIVIEVPLNYQSPNASHPERVTYVLRYEYLTFEQLLTHASTYQSIGTDIINGMRSTTDIAFYGYISYLFHGDTILTFGDDHGEIATSLSLRIDEDIMTTYPTYETLLLSWLEDDTIDRINFGIIASDFVINVDVDKTDMTFTPLVGFIPDVPTTATITSVTNMIQATFGGLGYTETSSPFQ